MDHTTAAAAPHHHERNIAKHQRPARPRACSPSATSRTAGEKHLQTTIHIQNGQQPPTPQAMAEPAAPSGQPRIDLGPETHEERAAAITSRSSPLRAAGPSASQIQSTPTPSPSPTPPAAPTSSTVGKDRPAHRSISRRRLRGLPGRDPPPPWPDGPPPPTTTRRSQETAAHQHLHVDPASVLRLTMRSSPPAATPKRSTATPA